MTTKADIYSWNNTPAVIKAFSPYTNSFFIDGGEVRVVLVLTNATVESRKTYLGMFATKPTDYVDGALAREHIEIYFWATETARKSAAVMRATPLYVKKGPFILQPDDVNFEDLRIRAPLYGLNDTIQRDDVLSLIEGLRESYGV